jgi:hypothetical protein
MRNVIKGALWAAMLASAFIASPSLAGFTSWVSPSCTKNADGSGWCSGSFRAFRDHADPNARADFYLNHYGAVSFYAQLNGQAYSCFFDATSPYVATFGSAAGQQIDQFFAVAFTKEGKCSYGYLYQGSSYGR